MVGNCKVTNEDDAGGSTSQLSIEKACEEYNNSVKLTLTLINHQLENTLTKNCNGLEELAVKIAARTNFLEKNPSFLSCLVYNKDDVKNEPLLEFDEIKITIKEHSKRILEKLDEIETHHNKLFQLVMSSGRQERFVQEVNKRLKEAEEDFHDCLSDHKIEHKPAVTNIEQSSLQKVIIQKNAYSDASLKESSSTPSPLKFQIFSDIPADVQRGKPQEDLHGKLMQQLVATDSLEGFLKLMGRKPQQKRKQKPKKEDLERKYTGSLWFFPQKRAKTLPQTKSAKVAKPETSTTSTYCNLLVTSSQPCPISNQDRARRIRQALVRPKLKCYDLLDDIDGNDVQPIKSEYPRRDNIGTLKLQEAKTYLHRMMEENDKVWKKLLQPKEAKKIQKPEEKKKKLSQQKAKNVKNLIEYLTAPEQKYLNHIPQSLIVMPVKIIYDNYPTKDETPRGAVLITDLSKPSKPMVSITKKTEKSEMPRIDETKVPECTRSSPFPMERKKEMLDQLRGLKMRNDNIQKNIQKAIDVIESKMIDLLSSPTDASSTEAFCAMEQEITNVLKMMNESDNKQTQKVEAEKDESHKTQPKLRRGLTTVKKHESENKKHETENKKREKSTDSRKSNASSRSTSPKLTSSRKSEKKEKKDEYVKIRVIKSQKGDDEVRKAANIEEGERLLGQVDSVIRKIDSIYTKFYDESKTSKIPKQETNVNTVLEFFDGLKQIIEPPPTVINYASYEDIPHVYQEATSYYQTKVEYDARLEIPPDEEIIEIIEEDIEPVKKQVVSPPRVDEPIKVEFVGDGKHEPVTCVGDGEQEEKREVVKKGEGKRELGITVIRDGRPELVKSQNKKRYGYVKYDKKEERYEYTLKAFYTLFFSGIFVALNMDYAS